MHPYFRAYLAGIALPTLVIPLVIAGLTLQHSNAHPFHIEDVLIFPIGLVPNAWGLWNMLHLRLRARWEVPTGVFGAALVLILAPGAYAIQMALGKMLWTPTLIAIGLPMTLVLYYLVWKYLVAAFNDMLGIG